MDFGTDMSPLQGFVPGVFGHSTYMSSLPGLWQNDNPTKDPEEFKYW